MEIKSIPITKPSEIDEIWFHYPCPDGFGCLVLYHIWRKWNGRDKDPLITRELNYGGEIPSAKGKRIVIFDFSFSKESDFTKLLSEATSLYSLDHHKTSEPIAKKYPENFLYDVEHSGVYLAFKYFFPDEKEIPLFVSAIEARDLWHLKEPLAKEMHAYSMNVLKKDLDLWYDTFVQYNANKFEPSSSHIYQTILKVGGIINQSE